MKAALERWLQRQWWRPRPGPAAWLLSPLSALHALLAAGLRVARLLGWRRAVSLPVPVIVVGNLIAGGAGKTPTVIALVAALQARGWRPGVISRGHGRRHDGVAEVPVHAAPAGDAAWGDEPALIRVRARVPVAVGRDRVAAARLLLRLHPALDIIVSDDGLQHARLARDLQVVVFDERGLGNGLLLPAGPLREHPAAAPPEGTLVLYNAAEPSTPWPGPCARRSLAGAVLLSAWWAGAPAHEQALQALRGRPVRAAAGIASPQRFARMLADAGLDVKLIALPDHHDFATLPWPADTPDVLVTEKDAIKLDPARTGRVRVWVVPLDFELPPAFLAALDAALPHLPRRPDRESAR